MHTHHLPGCSIATGTNAETFNKAAHRHAWLAGNGYTPYALVRQRRYAPFSQYIILDQIHGSSGATITAPNEASYYRPYAVTGDYIVTNQPHIACCVATADCTPVCIYAPDGPAIAVVHAGWRGIANGVIAHAISALCDTAACNPASLYAYIGPCARSCCYRVEHHIIEAVTAQITNAYVTTHVGYYLDILRCSQAHLQLHGVQAHAVHSIPHCTICHPHYASHRENGTAYRQITYAVIP